MNRWTPHAECFWPRIHTQVHSPALVLFGNFSNNANFTSILLPLGWHFVSNCIIICLPYIRLPFKLVPLLSIIVSLALNCVNLNEAYFHFHCHTRQTVQCANVITRCYFDYLITALLNVFFSKPSKLCKNSTVTGLNMTVLRDFCYTLEVYV